ncbi:unnamed protein product [Brassicogethes aeneus]|uniref:MADF domain-containing protein n=1 Tax=Brassicogethes aeneus TaxID=1431903 RepID=A0A9P0BD15_BRAAE|nr:unnamed protein product [Brassicogethes aeneus]
MEWNVEQTCKLIELYRQNSELWDTFSPLYKNKQKKHDAWNKIGKALNLGKDEVEKKMRCLIGQFQREQKKTKSGTGTGADEAYQSKWFAFKMLTFLQDKNKPRETIEAGIEKNNNELLENKRQEEAYSVLQSLKKNANQRDEYDIYGELIAKRIRKLDENIRDQVMHEIDNVIFKAKPENQKLIFFPQLNNYRNYLHQPNSSFVEMSGTQLPKTSLLPYSDTQSSQQPFPSHVMESQYSSASSLCSPRPCSQMSSYSENDFSHSTSSYGENNLLSNLSPIPPNSQPIMSYQNKTQKKSDQTTCSSVREYVRDFNLEDL